MSIKAKKRIEFAFWTAMIVVMWCTTARASDDTFTFNCGREGVRWTGNLVNLQTFPDGSGGVLAFDAWDMDNSGTVDHLFTDDFAEQPFWTMTVHWHGRTLRIPAYGRMQRVWSGGVYTVAFDCGTGP